MRQSTQPFTVVRVHDPAIDQSDDSGVDWQAFFADRDPARLRYLPGQLPMVFHCRPLTQPERREVMNLRVGGESSYESRERSFAYGLIRVERHVDDDGTVRPWERPDAGGAKAKPLGDAGLGHFGTTTIDEIGGVVEARSFLDRDQPLLCPLLATSALAFKATGRLHAARTSQSADRSDSSKQPPAATPPASPPPSPAGEGCGDATATGNPT
jgi:hypothetical protein